MQIILMLLNNGNDLPNHFPILMKSCSCHLLTVQHAYPTKTSYPFVDQDTESDCMLS